MSLPASPPCEGSPGELIDRIHVLLYTSAPEEAALTDAYHTVSRALEGTPGLLSNVLLRSIHDPCGFVVMSEWRDLESFLEWESGVDHRDVTAPMRIFQDDRAGRGTTFGIYTVTAAYAGGEHAPPDRAGQAAEADRAELG
ncbi:antibiotic biosynthesis monooxygenase family protein [Spirillospora sp. NPDC049652]